MKRGRMPVSTSSCLSWLAGALKTKKKRTSIGKGMAKCSHARRHALFKGSAASLASSHLHRYKHLQHFGAFDNDRIPALILLACS